ncbi:hypothetical protein CPK_ORF00392 [Chlamydia pneumoniae LPCoLN]|uniref:DUF648 domain-containing protein n=1 Tax=Chlamydia pneumoniae TaxID=83558 RepID=UPI0001BD9BCD|nr:DUF648 domain-containing protein [Chlamydia pneumoniae]ACZ32868.1 hypothetical protein CPK_ORF00392 [Chlamydia pneumoniae LPCoLN]ETR79750.1 hypothetical protein X556_0925 [Chlamydia pneumoniae B21]
MDVYRFSPVVPTSLRHRVMAALDDWFFLGGERIQIVDLQSHNSAAGVREHAAVSLLKQIVKLISFLLVPIVLIALLIRYLLHRSFDVTLVSKAVLSTDPLGVNLSEFQLPSSHVNSVESRTLLQAMRSPGVSVDVTYRRLGSVGKVIWLSDRELPEDLRCARRFLTTKELMGDYLKNMVSHVTHCLVSQGEAWLSQILEKTVKTSESLTSELITKCRFVGAPQMHKEFQTRLNELVIARGGKDGSVLEIDVLKLACQCWWSKFITVISSETFIEELASQVYEKLVAHHELWQWCEGAFSFPQQCLNSILRAVIHHGNAGIDVAGVGVICIMQAPCSVEFQIPFLRS